MQGTCSRCSHRREIQESKLTNFTQRSTNFNTNACALKSLLGSLPQEKAMERHSPKRKLGKKQCLSQLQANRL